MIRISHRSRWRIICISAIAVLIACGDGRARAQEAARKRLFAEMLRRRERLAREAEHAARPSAGVAAREAVAHATTRTPPHC